MKLKMDCGHEAEVSEVTVKLFEFRKHKALCKDCDNRPKYYEGRKEHLRRIKARRVK